MSYLAAAAATLSVFLFAGSVDPVVPQPDEPEECGGHAHQHQASDSRKWLKRHYDNPRLSKKMKRTVRHRIECAATPKDRRSIRAMYRSVKLPPRHDLWLRIGRCEQSGPGYGGVYWAHPGPTYQGGLGFWYGTFDAWKPAKYRGFGGKWRRTPADAGQAHWRVQMLVANRVYNTFGGSSPWGCG